MVTKPAVYKKREKWGGGKNQPLLRLLCAIIWPLVALWSAMVLLVRIGGVYGVTIRLTL